MKKMRILFSVLTLIAFQAHATIDAVDFTPSLVCVCSQTTFSSTSIVSGGATVTNWNWDLDADGQFDDAFGPSINFQFTTAGTFNVAVFFSCFYRFSEMTANTIFFCYSGREC